MTYLSLRCRLSLAIASAVVGGIALAAVIAADDGSKETARKVITKEQADTLIRAAGVAATQPATASRPASQPASAASAAFEVKCLKNEDRVFVSVGEGKAFFFITSPSGIGGATISRDADQWPKEIEVYLKLRSMECLEVSCGETTVRVAVSAHGAAAVSQHTLKSGKEGPALDKSLSE